MKAEGCSGRKREKAAAGKLVGEKKGMGLHGWMKAGVRREQARSEHAS